MTEYTPRKKPQQARSRATFDAIVEAGAQLLAEEGYHNLSTNRIAERAGVSIGSLYQYFPNKEAVVASVVEEFAERQFAILAEGIEEVFEAPLEKAVRILIDGLLAAKRAEPALSRALFDELPPVGQLDVMHHWTEQACALVKRTLEARNDDLASTDLDVLSFVLVTACHGVVHSTVVVRPELLDDERLARETTRLVLNYLTD